MVTAAVTVTAVCLFPSPADALCPQAVRDRYEPGEVVTIVGYTRGCIVGAAKSTLGEGRPLYGYLHMDPCSGADVLRCRANLLGDRAPILTTEGLLLGRFVVEETTHELRGLRISLSFTLPADLRPGAYLVAICQDPCSGHPIDGWRWPFYVGVDPPADWRFVHYWPLDDPAIDDLAADALLLGHDGGEVTAAQVRAGAAADQAANEDEAASDGSERTETAASAPDDEPDRRSGGTSLTLWIAGVALLVVGCRTVLRLGPTRKRIRPPARPR